MGVFGEFAERYFKAGFSPIPVVKKKPVTKEWSRYSDAQIDEDEFDSFLSKYKDCGIGIVLGPSTGIVGFDIDYLFDVDRKEWKGTDAEYEILKKTVEAEQDEIKAKIISMIPCTPCVKIGKEGKATYFYRAKGDFQSKWMDRNGLRLIDILWTGKQTVLPPSIHPDTLKPYRWINGDLTKHYEDLPELDWSVVLEIERLYAGNFIADKIDAKAIRGRNDLLKKSVFGMFRRGMIPEDCVEHLLEIDQTECNPPLFSDKTEYKHLHKTPHKAAERFAQNCYKSFKSNLKKELPNMSQIFKNAQFDEDGDPYEQIGFYFRYAIPKKDGSIAIKKVPKFELMADHVFENKNMCFDDSQSLIFNGKNWEWMTKNHLNNFVWQQNQTIISPAHLDNFVKAIRSKCHLDSMGFKETTAKINCDNGVIDVITGEFTPHSYQYLFKYCLSAPYDKDAKCPSFLAFLNEIFLKDQKLIKLIQQMIGYVLMGGDPFLHFAFVLYGTGRNGKSTLLDVIRALIGAGGYSTVSMGKLDREFSLVTIDGKLANIVEETPTDEINAEIFKAIVGGGEVQAAHKGFEEFSMRVNARFLFACNDMPVFKDKSLGLSDRLVFIPFDRYFAEGERDTEIKPKLMAELSGILNWAIEGAMEIARNRSLEIPERCLATKNEYKKESDSVYSWFCECIEVDEKANGIESKVLHEKYKTWCEEDGRNFVGMQKFVKSFRHLVKQECKRKNVKFDEDVRFFIGAKKVRGYKNVWFKD